MTSVQTCNPESLTSSYPAIRLSAAPVQWKERIVRHLKQEISHLQYITSKEKKIELNTYFSPLAISIINGSAVVLLAPYLADASRLHSYTRDVSLLATVLVGAFLSVCLAATRIFNFELEELQRKTAEAQRACDEFENEDTKKTDGFYTYLLRSYSDEEIKTSHLSDTIEEYYEYEAKLERATNEILDQEEGDVVSDEEIVEEKNDVREIAPNRHTEEKEVDDLLDKAIQRILKGIDW